ncbi:unnamed protein product [Rhizoctonia solani]|uniref:Uncharacterized protein n=1 Tax=Rhizoctonia solani TaxID=456999 RepID=A0A8H3BKC1_9AGAM|nr:unnamed protein product [Rhizoctonia solani]CAE6457951.1 unnamed protein product [Rhizoctonia solani]
MYSGNYRSSRPFEAESRSTGWRTGAVTSPRSRGRSSPVSPCSHDSHTYVVITGSVGITIGSSELLCVVSSHTWVQLAPSPASEGLLITRGICGHLRARTPKACSRSRTCAYTWRGLLISCTSLVGLCNLLP